MTFFDLLPELDLRAVFLHLLLQAHAHLVRAMARDEAAAEIVRHAVGIDREGQIVHRRADIDPVGHEHVDRLLRQIEGLDDLARAVARDLDEIGVILEHLDLAHGRDGDDVHAARDAVAEHDEVIDLLVRAGADGVHIARHALEAVVQDRVDALLRQEHAVALRHGQPVDIDAHLIEPRADDHAVVLRADGHHFVQRRLDLEAVAHEVGGDAAGHVVLLKDENVLHALRLQLQRGGHARERAADDDDVIVLFVKAQSGFLLYLNTFTESQKDT